MQYIQEVYEDDEDLPIQRWKELYKVDVGDGQVVDISTINREEYPTGKDFLGCIINCELKPNLFLMCLDNARKVYGEDLMPEIEATCLEAWGETFTEMKEKSESFNPSKMYPTQGAFHFGQFPQ